MTPLGISSSFLFFVHVNMSAHQHQTKSHLQLKANV